MHDGREWKSCNWTCAACRMPRLGRRCSILATQMCRRSNMAGSSGRFWAQAKLLPRCGSIVEGFTQVAVIWVSCAVARPRCLPIRLKRDISSAVAILCCPVACDVWDSRYVALAASRTCCLGCKLCSSGLGACRTKKTRNLRLENAAVLETESYVGEAVALCSMDTRAESCQ
jgi:hypothetical protein